MLVSFLLFTPLHEKDYSQAGGENMKKKGKKHKRLRWLKWFFILPLFIAIMFFGLHSIKMEKWAHEKQRSEHAILSQIEGQAFSAKQERPANFEGDISDKKYGDEKGEHSHKHHDEKSEKGSEHHKEEFDGIFFVPFLLELGLVLSGWLLLRRSEGNTAKKWTGILLLVVGLFPLLPILALAAGITWVYKKCKQRKETTSWMADDHMYSFTPTSYNANILDEWERNIRKEEK